MNAKGPYGLPHAKFGGPGARDIGLVVNGGAIIGRMALPYRRGEEYITMKALAKLEVLILYMVYGNGLFEVEMLYGLSQTCNIR